MNNLLLFPAPAGLCWVNVFKVGRPELRRKYLPSVILFKNDFEEKLDEYFQYLIVSV